MKKIYLSDHKTELIFSTLRWIFLLVAVILFYTPFFYENLLITRETFSILLLIGIFYMSITQLVLLKKDLSITWFKRLAGIGVLFDVIAMFWLFALTGGVSTFLFPIAYFVVMHATIYWKMKGAFVSSISITLGYLALFLAQNSINFTTIFLLSLNIGFMWLIGLFGSLIVIRERHHLGEKERAMGMLAIDYLTGLFNHRTFQEDLRTLNERRDSFYIVLGDIDYFKRINDEYGHVTGDQLLSTLGTVFQEFMKGYSCRSYRYGGEEFAFLVEGNMNIEQFMRDIYTELSKITLCEGDISVQMSFGVEKGPTKVTPAQLVDKTDRLLYRAKKEGKNHALFFNDVRIFGENKTEVGAM